MPVVVCLSLCRRDVADGLEQAVVAKPGHPFQRGELDRLLGLPGRVPVDQLCLVQAIDRLGQRVVVAVALAAQRGLDTRLGRPFAVADADVLGEFNPSSQHIQNGGVDEAEDVEIESIVAT